MANRLLLALAAFMLLVAPLQTFLTLGGDFTEYLRYEALRGQVAYLAAKLLALYSIIMVWAQALLGLLRHRALPTLFNRDARCWALTHRVLGLGTAAAVAGHVVLFVTATSMRNGELAWDLLLPSPSGYYRSMVSLGVLAFWLMAFAIAGQVFRLWSPAKRRALHRLVLPSIVLVLVHSVAIGTESRAGWMLWSYWFMSLTLLAALGDWLVSEYLCALTRPSPNPNENSGRYRRPG